MDPQVLFDGPLWVHYGQVYVVSDPDTDPDMAACFAGQRNGLLGAAVPGRLWLTTGLHTGEVRFRVELRSEPPPPAAMGEWEEVVEASFRPASGDVQLCEWAYESTHPLSLRPVVYRVRYSARDMDAARERDTLLDGEEPIDSYLLELWPSDEAPDAVLEQTGETAAYWHDWAASGAR